MDQAQIDLLQEQWIMRHAVEHCLNVGCGERPIPWAVNIDPNPTRSKWSDYPFDVHDLPFADGSFDSVVSIHVLNALPLTRPG